MNNGENEKARLTRSRKVALPPKRGPPNGWLRDLLHTFDEKEGFSGLQERINASKDVHMVAALIRCVGWGMHEWAAVSHTFQMDPSSPNRPLANCIDFVTEVCVTKDITPVVVGVVLHIH